MVSTFSHHAQFVQQLKLNRFPFFLGETAIVIKILIGLAAQVTDEGDLTPLNDSARAGSKITVDDFLQSTTSHRVNLLFFARMIACSLTIFIRIGRQYCQSVKRYFLCID